MRWFIRTLAVVALALRLWNLGTPNLELGPAWLMTATGVLGLVFLASGLTIRTWYPVPATSLFVLHCVGQAIHWGGPPALDGAARISVWLVYFVISVLGDSALVVFVLRYLKPGPMRRGQFALLWAPSAILGVLAVAIVSLGETPFAETLFAAFLTIEVILANGLGLAAIIVLAWRAFGPSDAPNGMAPLRTMLAASLLATLPWILGMLAQADIAGNGAQPLTLGFAIMPVGFVYAIARQARTGA